MEKVIFIDVDGTLRNDDREITKRTIKSVQDIKLAGYEPIIATGRPRDYAKKLREEIGASRYVILNNGAEIYDYESDAIIYQNFMKNQRILELYKFSNLENIRFILATKGTRYVNRVKHPEMETLITETIEEFLDKNEKIIQVTIASADFDTIKNMYNDVIKVTNVRIMNQSKSLVDSSFVRDKTIYYDIVDEGTSKGMAIKEFYKKFKIKKENCIAIGDDRNDISMFDEVGTKIAMGNALEEVKEIADIITESNNDHGVAIYLEKLYKKQEKGEIIQLSDDSR